MSKRDSKEQILTNIMLMVFRLNGRLLEKGDDLVETLGINSARWQILGPVFLAGNPLTTPQIAEAMGISRQGAQKQLNKMVVEGFFEAQANPRHERSPLYKLTTKGQQTIEEAMKRQAGWATHLTQRLVHDDLTCALNLLNQLYQRLESSVTIQGAK